MLAELRAAIFLELISSPECDRDYILIGINACFINELIKVGSNCSKTAKERLIKIEEIQILRDLRSDVMSWLGDSPTSFFGCRCENTAMDEKFYEHRKFLAENIFPLSKDGVLEVERAEFLSKTACVFDSNENLRYITLLDCICLALQEESKAHDSVKENCVAMVNELYDVFINKT
jgi:hypothetical protein